jgi:hypothetical protein
MKTSTHTILYCLVAALTASRVTAAYVPIFGGPEYDSSTGTGYRESGGLPTNPVPRSLVNNSGVATGTVIKVNSGSPQGRHAIQWLSSTMPIEMSTPTPIATPFTEQWVYSINDAGFSVGAVYNTQFGERPVRWDSSGTATELGILDTNNGGNFTWGQAYAINNAGTTVGYTDRWNVFSPRGGGWADRAVRWNAAGAVTELGEISTAGAQTPWSRAYAVNQRGTTVGWADKIVSNMFLGTRAVRWDGAGIAATELDMLGTPPPSITNSEANDVNESGTAVGWSQKFAPGMNLGTRAVRWDAGGTAATELETLGGLNFSQAYAINDAGDAVGIFRRTVISPPGNRAVRWDASGTAATELGELGADGTSNALDTNNSGIVVGNAVKFIGSVSAGVRAVTWGNDDVAIDLNDLIDPQSGWTLTTATNISDTGWITGIGQFDPDGPGGLEAYNRHFLLHLAQIPEPDTLFLTLFAAAGLLRLRR